jgi:hypothetical protein
LIADITIAGSTKLDKPAYAKATAAFLELVKAVPAATDKAAGKTADKTADKTAEKTDATTTATVAKPSAEVVATEKTDVKAADKPVTRRQRLNK